MADIAAIQRRLTARGQSERERMRAKAPELAAFVDELRANGIDCRLTYIRFADGEERGLRRQVQPHRPVPSNAQIIQMLKDEALARGRRR